MRLIDADALMKDLETWLKQVDPTNPQEDNAIPPMEDIIVSTLMTIEEQPTIEERKTGKWINAYPDIEPNPMLMYGICSVCGFEQSISDKLKYCPNCGSYNGGD